jgi:hypothetical protein
MSIVSRKRKIGDNGDNDNDNEKLIRDKSVNLNSLIAQLTPALIKTDYDNYKKKKKNWDVNLFRALYMWSAVPVYKENRPQSPNYLRGLKDLIDDHLGRVFGTCYELNGQKNGQKKKKKETDTDTDNKDTDNKLIIKSKGQGSLITVTISGYRVVGEILCIIFNSSCAVLIVRSITNVTIPVGINNNKDIHIPESSCFSVTIHECFDMTTTYEFNIIDKKKKNLKIFDDDDRINKLITINLFPNFIKDLQEAFGYYYQGENKYILAPPLLSIVNEYLMAIPTPPTRTRLYDKDADDADDVYDKEADDDEDAAVRSFVYGYYYYKEQQEEMSQMVLCRKKKYDMSYNNNNNNNNNYKMTNYTYVAHPYSSQRKKIIMIDVWHNLHDNDHVRFDIPNIMSSRLFRGNEYEEADVALDGRIRLIGDSKKIEYELYADGLIEPHGFLEHLCEKEIKEVEFPNPYLFHQKVIKVIKKETKTEREICISVKFGYQWNNHNLILSQVKDGDDFICYLVFEGPFGPLGDLRLISGFYPVDGLSFQLANDSRVRVYTTMDDKSIVLHNNVDNVGYMESQIIIRYRGDE